MQKGCDKSDKVIAVEKLAMFTYPLHDDRFKTRSCRTHHKSMQVVPETVQFS